MNYAIILAGGVGSRFWPLSRQTEPKQFLSVCSAKPMVEETIERIAPLIEKKNIFIATNKIHKEKIGQCLKKLKVPAENVLFEPQGRNTFPPIVFLSYRISKTDPDAVISVLPCDHVIENNEKFVKLLSRAITAAALRNIVTFGVLPKRPETGYGYIKVAQGRQSHKGAQVYEIKKFIEKPDLPRAKKFVRDKRYYWNSGIFVFRADVLLEESKRLLPEAHNNLITEKNFNRLWESLPATSIDYAIMEKTKRIALLPADYGWLDLGSWQAIEEVLKKDKSGNIFKGKCLDIDSKNTFVWSGSRLIATIGLSEVIIVDTEDALLVCSKDKTQAVKNIVQALKEKNFREQL